LQRSVHPKIRDADVGYHSESGLLGALLSARFIIVNIDCVD